MIGIKQNAVIYARVSSKEQEEEGFSVPAQLKLLREYAVLKGFTVINDFIDVETAKQSGRTNFGRMVDLLKNSKDCRIILVEKTDRLYRNFPDYVKLDALDLEIHLVKENSIISKNSRSHEKLTHGLKVLLAKNFIDNLSEETKKGMIEKAEEGQFPSHAPLGYKNVIGPNGKHAITPNPDEAPLIRKVFEWYATGNYSIEEISRMAKDAGLSYRRSGKPLSKSNIDHILQNPIYYGDFYWSGKKYAGNHEPIISKELWDITQNVRRTRMRPKHHGGKQRWAFQGLIRCGHCGCLLTAEKRKGKYVYYHCTGQKGKCPERYVREEIIAEQYGDYLQQLIVDDEVLTWIKDSLRSSNADKERFCKESVDTLQKHYNRLQERLDRMYEDKLDGRIDAAYFDAKSKTWRAEQEDTLRKISAYQKADEKYMEAGIQILELVQNAHRLYQKQPLFERRRLINFVFSNSIFKDGRLEPKLRNPFDFLAKTNIAYQKKKAVDSEIHDLRPTWGG